MFRRHTYMTNTGHPFSQPRALFSLHTLWLTDLKVSQDFLFLLLLLSPPCDALKKPIRKFFSEVSLTTQKIPSDPLV